MNNKKEDFEGITVYDNGGATADRYTVIFPTGDTYGMSRDADMPNGVCMYIGHKDSICIDHTIEKRIDVDALPDGVKKQIKYLLSQEVKTKQYAERILNFVLDELDDRDLIKSDEYDELFGCASFDEVAEGINNILKEMMKRRW